LAEASRSIVIGSAEASRSVVIGSAKASRSVVIARLKPRAPLCSLGWSLALHCDRLG